MTSSRSKPADRGRASLVSIAILTFSTFLGLGGCRPIGPGAPNEQATPIVAAKDTETPECCQKPEEAKIVAKAGAGEAEARPFPVGLDVPRTTLIDQDGRPVNLYDDLVKDRTVVMNFMFTTCKGVCPPMGVNFAALQKQLGDSLGEKLSLISISVDPVTDTPQRLKAWATQFGARPGWTLLTGPKADVDGVLKSLGVFAANKTDHSPFLLVGTGGRWSRIHGLSAPERVAQIARDLALESKASVGSDAGSKGDWTPDAEKNSAARRYFTDMPLVNQRGETMRLYSDLLDDKVVLINFFFAECKGSCPVMMTAFARIQEHVKDRMEKEVRLISISVDPAKDTPSRLAEYASSLKALPGWYFMTGAPEDVTAALQKLGQKVAVREDHSNIFIIGNLRTGLWKKVMGLADTADINKILDDVIDDRVPTSTGSTPDPTEKP
jgi:protein SCO1